jgi:K(+)-stimulated pyrophosphate-energized sodium pump
VILDISEPEVFAGLLLGGAIPFFFSSLSINAVERAAAKVIEEVREQFKRPGVMEGKTNPDYSKVVSIVTLAAQKELFVLALVGVLAPLIAGLLLGEIALGAFLAGVILVGQLLAVFMANAGAAWDNAKKRIEEGLYGGKGSEQHKAAVIGDTIGDPLKDTAGPSLNPMIKVINLVSLIFAPLIVKLRQNIVLALALSLILIAILAIIIILSRREIS